MPSTHPTEQLLEYVLATLSHDEMSHIDAHVRVCETCQQHIQALHHELFDSASTQPRAHIKSQLFNVVTFDRDFGAVLSAARYGETLRWIWAVALFIVGSAFASIVLWNGYFNRTQLHLQTMPTRERVVTDTSLIADFMAQDGIITMRFAPVQPPLRSTLHGYVHPRQPGILLVGRDFAPLVGQDAYVVWLVDGVQATLVGVFDVDATGTAWVYMPQLQLCNGCALTVTHESIRNPTAPADTHLFNMVYSR